MRFLQQARDGCHESLPKELKHLAWLSLDDADGQEYWTAMNLMGRYAAANHALIHKHVAKKLGAHLILDIENHHNFAWKETHVVNGEAREVIVHRKGATPAGAGVLGIIPVDGIARLCVVRGKGSPASSVPSFRVLGQQRRVAVAGDRDERHDQSQILTCDQHSDLPHLPKFQSMRCR
ncbi:MAG: RtcB family protein [Chthoniobacter sp.]|nr:RtcB family protein [Chthoniobacter sp.]